MNVEIKWQNLDGQKWFNDKLINLAKQYINNQNLNKFNFQISLEPNSRHIINLLINTNKDNQTIDVESNSYNLENSFQILEKQLKEKIKHFDPNAKEKNQLKQEKIAEKIRKNKEEAIKLEKKKLEEKELKLKDKLANEEREKSKKLQKKNEEILKKLEKNRKIDEEEDSKIIAELEEQKKELEKAKKIEQENKEKLNKHMETLKFDVIAEDLQENEEIQEKIKEDKKKLRDLQSEENECLVIIEEIKELDKSNFDPDKYKVNEPFSLANYWFYYDQANNFYIATDQGQWAPIDYNEVLNYYELDKANKFQELELRLIEARKRRKLHLKDLVDGSELLKQLEESKHNHKKLEKQQKDAFKKLKENYEKTANELKTELQDHANPIKIDIAEIHEANEPFLTENNVYAYHDGEGHYFITDENNQWIPTTKDNVYNKSKLIENNYKNEKQPGEQFKNSKGDDCYFDGEIYYKLVNNEWIGCSPAEALDLDLKKEYEEKKGFFNKKNKTESLKVFDYQQNDKKDNNQNNQINIETNNANNNHVQEQVNANSQQWTDENGTTWYLDELGNYYWWDGNEWQLYTYQ